MADPTPSTSHLKRYRPYLRPADVERLSAKQRGKLSVAREERARQQACALIDAVGVRCGFPRRTIATAQTLYMRFHLFFAYADFGYTDVSLTTLYVASKLHDTLKKPRDIILSSYALRFPQLVRRGGHVDVTAIDPGVLEQERRRVLSIERLVLETMCFAFRVSVPFPLVIKLARRMGLGREATQAAWRMAVDCHRTPAPLSYPPHIIALGSIYAAVLLANVNPTPHAAPSSSDDPADADAAPSSRVLALLGSPGDWESTYAATIDEVDEVAHALLDLYTTILSTPANDPSLQLFALSSPSPVSPREQPLPRGGGSSGGAGSGSAAAGGTSRSARPSPAPTSAVATAFRLAPGWTAQALTELKIHLRDRRPGAVVGWDEFEELEGEGDELAGDMDGMGRNDATMRFVWDDEA